MRFHQQRNKLPVTDTTPSNFHQNVQSRHGPLLPDSIRCIICGPSNCGKTNAMIALLLDINGLRFENIYVYSKSLHQLKYLMLGEILKQNKNIGYFTFNDNTEILPPSESKPNSVFIFDDVACDPQNSMREYFSMGRHRDVDSFYLCQTYSRILKQLIRDNSNFLVVFKQDHMNLRHIYDDHVNTDMKFTEFQDMCAACWKIDKFGFLVINKDSLLNNGRYRRGFDVYITM